MDALGWLSWNGRRTPHGVRELKDFIIILRMSTRSHCVAPCTGAGIEIVQGPPGAEATVPSHPVWVRELKSLEHETVEPVRGRTPHGVREVKYRGVVHT